MRFRRTGERRYGVTIEPLGRSAQVMDPAPGFDTEIPHDLVHYVVEAELGLTSGVFGRAAKGGGTFMAVSDEQVGARERARLRRRQRRRDETLASHDRSSDMATSERLAGIADLTWRKKHGQRPDPALWHSPPVLAADDVLRVERVVARLDVLAPIWRQTPVGGELTFRWPSVTPC